MNQVITAKQARLITGGHMPLVPIEYERAVRDLALCQTIDEAKYFSDKSDALAAWAKIYKDDEAGNEARKLKLHAFKRMGLLARELNPHTRKGNKNAIGTTWNTPQKALICNGLNELNAKVALAVSKVDDKKFDLAVKLKRPPAPSVFVARNWGTANWRHVTGAASHLRNLMAKYSPHEIAQEIEQSRIATAKNLISGINNWITAWKEETKNYYGSQILSNKLEQLAAEVSNRKGTGIHLPTITKVENVLVEVSEWFDELDQRMAKTKEGGK